MHGKILSIILVKQMQVGVFLVCWLGFFFVCFVVLLFFYVYGLNEQTGEFKYSLAKNPVRFIESVNFRDFFENLLS